MSDDDGDDSIQFVQDGDTESIQFLEDNESATPLDGGGGGGAASLRSRRSRANSRLTFKTEEDGKESVKLAATLNDDGAASVSSAPGGGWFVSGNTDPEDSAGESAANSQSRRRSTKSFAPTALPLQKQGSAASSIQFESLRRGKSNEDLTNETGTIDNGSIAFTIEEVGGGPQSSPEIKPLVLSTNAASERTKKTIVSTVLRDRGGSVARQMRQRAAAQAANMQLPRSQEEDVSDKLKNATPQSQLSSNMQVQQQPISSSKKHEDEFVLDFPPLRQSTMPSPLQSATSQQQQQNGTVTRRSSSLEVRGTGGAPGDAVATIAEQVGGVVHARSSSKQLVLQHLLEQESSNVFVQKASSTLVAASSGAQPATAAAQSGSTPSKQRQSIVTLSFPPAQAPAVSTNIGVTTDAVGYSMNVSWVTPEDIELATQLAENIRLYKEVQREELRMIDDRVKKEADSLLVLGSSKMKKATSGQQRSLSAEDGRRALEGIALHQRQQEMQHAIDVKKRTVWAGRSAAHRGGAADDSPSVPPRQGLAKPHQHMTSSAVMKRAPSAQPVLIIPKVVIRDQHHDDPISSNTFSHHVQNQQRHNMAGDRKPIFRQALAPGLHRVNGQSAAADYAKQLRKEKLDAYLATASTFGIAWPPKSQSDSLYFVSGVRLTDAQVSQFYCAAEERHRHLTEEAAAVGTMVSNGTSPSPRGLDFLLLSRPAQKTPQAADQVPCQKFSDKRRVGRTSVLREVFGLLDIEGTGELRSSDLLTLRGLLVQEMEILASNKDGGADESLLRAAAANTNGGKSTSALTPTGKKRYASLCEFAADVAIPVLVESGSPRIDFPLFSMVVQQKLHQQRHVDEQQHAPVLKKASGVSQGGGDRTGVVWQHYADTLLESLRSC